MDVIIKKLTNDSLSDVRQIHFTRTVLFTPKQKNEKPTVHVVVCNTY